MAYDPMRRPGRVPAAPLVPYVRAALLRCGSRENLAHRLATRLGGDPRSWERQVNHITSGDYEYMGLDMADRLACALGAHPVMIWPVEWAHAGWTMRPKAKANKEAAAA